HRLEEIEALSSQALLMESGRVRYSGDLETLRHRFEKPQIEVVFTDSAAADVAATDLAARGVHVVQEENVLTCSVAGQGGVGEVLSALGPLARTVLHIRDMPMPLRDLI